MIRFPYITLNVYDPPPPPDPEPVKVFKQEDVDKIVAEARRKDQAELQKQTNELKKLKETSNLTTQEKVDLQKRIDQMEDQYKTKEQLAAQELERKDARYKEEMESATKERDRWKGSYEETTISNAILLNSTDAVNSEQIHDILRPKSRLVEEIVDGKLNGKFIVMVKIVVTDKKTKQPVSLDLPIHDAVKQMKENPERYGNLFKSTVSGGAGGGGGKGGRPPATGPLDGDTIKGMSDAEYKEYRETHGLARKSG